MNNNFDSKNYLVKFLRSHVSLFHCTPYFTVWDIGEFYGFSSTLIVHFRLVFRQLLFRDIYLKTTILQGLSSSYIYSLINVKLILKICIFRRKWNKLKKEAFLNALYSFVIPTVTCWNISRCSLCIIINNFSQTY